MSGGNAILEAEIDGVLKRLEVDCIGRRLALESRSGRVLGDIPDDFLHFTGRPLAFLVHFLCDVFEFSQFFPSPV